MGYRRHGLLRTQSQLAVLSGRPVLELLPHGVGRGAGISPLLLWYSYLAGGKRLTFCIGLEKLGRRFTISYSLILGGACCAAGAFVRNVDSLDLVLYLAGKLFITCAFAAVFLITSEVYPTSVRSAGVGFCNLFGRLSTIVSPYIGLTEEWAYWVPMTFFAVNSILSGVFVRLFLPETKGRRLPETISEAESLSELRTAGSEEDLTARISTEEDSGSGERASLLCTRTRRR